MEVENCVVTRDARAGGGYECGVIGVERSHPRMTVQKPWVIFGGRMRAGAGVWGGGVVGADGNQIEPIFWKVHLLIHLLYPFSGRFTTQVNT